jgi:hypothetical protein
MFIIIIIIYVYYKKNEGTILYYSTGNYCEVCCRIKREHNKYKAVIILPRESLRETMFIIIIKINMYYNKN